MMRLRDFSCGLFFMLQVSGTIVMYIKGRKHKLQAQPSTSCFICF